MQIMIDLLVESAESLELTAEFLEQHAKLKRAASMPEGFNTEDQATPDVPTGTQADDKATHALDALAASMVETHAARDPRDSAFRGHTDATPPIPPPLPSNVVPFVPAPPAPPAVPAGPAPAATNANPTTTVPTPPVNTAGASSLELDASGMPWDERIHTKNKSKKTDGTWRLAKGLAPGVLESVTQELHARMINSPAPTAPSVPAAPVVEVPAPSFPGSVPVPPVPVGTGAENVPASNSTGGVPVPPVPAVGGLPPSFGKAPLPPGVAPAAPAVSLQPVPPVPVPVAPALGVPDAGNAAVVPPAPDQMTEYRQFVAKAMAARNDGRLAGDAISSIVQQAGAPSIQLLGNMTHLVPRASFILDATLAGWTREQIAAHIAQVGL